MIKGGDCLKSKVWWTTRILLIIILTFFALYGCEVDLPKRKSYIERDLKSFNKIILEKEDLKIWMDRDWKDNENVVITHREKVKK